MITKQNARLEVYDNRKKLSKEDFNRQSSEIFQNLFNIEEFKTKAEYSPFDGEKYVGMPVMTIVNGKTVMNKI